MTTLHAELPEVSTHRQPDRHLRWAAWGFAVGALLHNADHFRRGTASISGQLFAIGSTGSVISAVVIYLVLSGHRYGALAAVSAGFPLAIGFVAVHWLPHWSVVSDSFLQGHPSWMSITASILEIAGALALAVTGLLALRRAGGLASIVR